MNLIVCEKQVAAERIAKILSDGKCSVSKGAVPYYSFPKHLVVGLSGHVLKVDFADEFSSWNEIGLKDLVKANVLYLPDKAVIIKLVKSLAKKADELIIATDYDTEGESIGLEAVNIVNSVKKMPVKRMHFSSIVKDEIIDSYKKLTKLDVNLADAADARREIDLIWGAVLTRFLSLVTKRLGSAYLSAGRVQSPTLSLIVEKEKERMKFKSEPYWEFPLVVKKDNAPFTAHYATTRVFDEKLKVSLNKIRPKQALVKGVKVAESSSRPIEPFNTTSFLREASSIGFSSMGAMAVAESLYLKGLISYPRTDNEVYPKSLDAKKILDSFKGTKYESCLKFLNPLLNPTKGAKETKDHPPIHPTGQRPEGLEARELKIYDLVVRRFISTFCLDCVEESTKAQLEVIGFDFVADGYRIIKPGWKGVYTFSSKKDNVLPELVKGDLLKVVSLDCVAKETQPPKRYGHGTLIKMMSDLNVGTKSTRPSIIKKLIGRYYIFNSKSLAPTPVAMAVMNALDSYANLITEPSMTRELEEEMELVANGKLTKRKVVDQSRKLLLEVLGVLEVKRDIIANNIREGIKSSYVAGPCPVCKHDMIIRIAHRSGKRFIGCSHYPDCHNSYPLPQHGLVQITNDVCKHCGLKKIALIRKGKRPFTFCSNLDCPSREGDEETIKLKKSRDKYLKSLATKKANAVEAQKTKPVKAKPKPVKAKPKPVKASKK
ncbi:MAG: DNA topoisomerase I [Candidatus Nanoarchaeia archaeon]|jgi:DNA topoisomerase-1